MKFSFTTKDKNEIIINGIFQIDFPILTQPKYQGFFGVGITWRKPAYSNRYFSSFAIGFWFLFFGYSIIISTYKSMATIEKR